MFLDPIHRLSLINEAISTLLEYGFTDALEQEALDNTGEETMDKSVDKYGRPKSAAYKEFLNLRRNANLKNQAGLKAYDPKGRTQNYSPAWNVRGDQRREQSRAYLNYIRSDPERLARFRSQSDNNRIVPVASFAGRPESEVQSKLAAYNQQARERRISSIETHSPQVVNPLRSAIKAGDEANQARKNFYSLPEPETLDQIRSRNLQDRKNLESSERTKMSPVINDTSKPRQPTPAPTRYFG